MEKDKLKTESNNANVLLPAVPSQGEKTWFEKGDKILYQYTHHLNSRSTTEIVKKGVFVRVVKRKGISPYDWQPNRRVVVMLEGNKNESTVWESEIRHCR